MTNLKEKQTILFTTASKPIKHLGLNLTKWVKICTLKAIRH